MRQNKLWYYTTQVGTFYIRPNHEGRFTLYIEGDFLMTFLTPTAAADTVYYQNTGYHPWDRIPTPVHLPPGLSEWRESIESDS